MSDGRGRRRSRLGGRNTADKNIEFGTSGGTSKSEDVRPAADSYGMFGPI